MKYLLLIYQNEKAWADLSVADRQAFYAEFAPLREQIVKNGNYVAAEKLQDTATATTVRVRDGKPLLTDGPFAETREQLGGFFLVEAKDLDEATAIAARIPIARLGSIEVRPIDPMRS
jgi:hypothetical protein